MPFSFNDCDCSPLVIDNEFEIEKENILSEYVGKIILGQHAHVRRIIKTLASNSPIFSVNDIDLAKNHLESTGKSRIEIEKRDGWVFQIISWLVLLNKNKTRNFYCQQPHDAPAQHGLDGIAIILNDKNIIENIIITEDKCTENQRTVLPQVWDEFRKFEEGENNNKVISRISAQIDTLEEGKILETCQNDICKKNLWQYRVGINRNNTYKTKDGRIKLFKGYDTCVTGDNPHRRFASTIHKDEIRKWMEDICQKVIKYLESQK